MNRYQTTTQIKTESGIRRASTTIIQIPESDSDRYIKTITAERLDKLAVDFYNDVTMWWVIAAANGIGKGTFLVPPDTVLRIPSISNINEVIQQINKSR
jgi:hypothetical protein